MTNTGMPAPADPSPPSSNWCTWWARMVGLLPTLLVGGLAIYLHIHTLPRVDYDSSTPTIDRSRPLMVALGDSFIAGEGTEKYLNGTSNPPVNVCHRSNAAYPFLIAKAFDYRLVAATCSGAVTDDIVGTQGQWPDSDDSLYAARPQLAYVKSSPLHDDASEVDVVLLSIGGNDALFADVVKKCLTANCIPNTRVWMDNLERVGPRLFETYRTIGEVVPQARKIVMNYPDLIAPGSCRHRLTAAEVAWVRLRFLPRLNRIIAFEAANAGWEVVDNTNAFLGARICEVGVPTKEEAANFIKVDQLNGPDPAGDLIRGSFHPKPLGHQLFAGRLLTTLEQDPPHLEPCEPGKTCPPTPPPDPSIPPPGGFQPLPVGALCARGEITVQTIATVSDDRSKQLSAVPDSEFCYREWGSEKWKTGTATNGRANLSTARLADQETLSIEVLTRQSDTAWTRTLLNAEPRQTIAGEKSVRQLKTIAIGLAIGVAVAVLACAALPFLMCFLRRRTGRAVG